MDALLRLARSLARARDGTGCADWRAWADGSGPYRRANAHVSRSTPPLALAARFTAGLRGRARLYARSTIHQGLALTLLVLRLFLTDDHHHPMTADHLATVAARLHRRSHFHVDCLLIGTDAAERVGTRLTAGLSPRRCLAAPDHAGRG
jgi:hypothetical protein